MTFKQYLEGRISNDDALSSFRRMALADDAMPDARKWITLRYYPEGRETS